MCLICDQRDDVGMSYDVQALLDIRAADGVLADCFEGALGADGPVDSHDDGAAWTVGVEPHAVQSRPAGEGTPVDEGQRLSRVSVGPLDDSRSQTFYTYRHTHRLVYFTRNGFGKSRVKLVHCASC